MLNSFFLFLFLIHTIYFQSLGMKNLPTRELPLSDRKYYCLVFFFIEPWKTRYYWGGLSQVFLIFLSKFV